MPSPNRLRKTLLAVALCACDPGVYRPPREAGVGDAGARGPEGGVTQDGSVSRGDSSAPPDRAMVMNPPDAAPMRDASSMRLDPSFRMMLPVQTTISVLGVSHSVPIVFESVDGFAGDIDLSVTDLPTPWVSTFSPARISLSPGGSAQAALELGLPTEAQEGLVTVTVRASSGVLAQSAPYPLTVLPEFTVHIASGVATTNNPAAFGANPTRLRLGRNGTKVRWINDDRVAHRIHGPGVGGFDHQPIDLAPGQTYQVEIKAVGTYDYNCHLHGGMQGQLVVIP